MAAQAFFLPARDGSRPGQRLCVFHATRSARPHGLVLYVHPFAEEMNKSRRMAALTSRALASAGFDVLLMDLHGCGDSSGDFGDASWRSWIDDVLSGCAWLRRHRCEAPLWLWGLRAGCLLAVEAARQAELLDVNFLFWQPPASGKLALQQFLRLRLAADLADGKSGGAVRELRERLRAGQRVEVAGYTLDPTLAEGFEAATLEPASNPRRLEWIDIAAPTSPAQWSLDLMERWQLAGASIARSSWEGPSFWQTTEVETAPTLIESTVSRLLATGTP